MRRWASIYIIAFCLFFGGGFVFVRKYIPPHVVNKTGSLCKDCNILLISLDTCGAKHMSAYGYERDTTPNLKALVKTGVLFENAYANATWTLPSHVSIFTGLFPYNHKVLTEKNVLTADTSFLPEILLQHGYNTAFFIPDSDYTLPKGKVYNRGISSFISEGYGTEGYFARALEYLNANTKKEKTFVFFHTYICHSPYLTEGEPLLYAPESIPSIPVKTEDVYLKPLTESYMQFLEETLPVGLQKGEFEGNPDRIVSFLDRVNKADSFLMKKQIYDDAVLHNWWGDSNIHNYFEDFFYWRNIEKTNNKHIEFIRAVYDQKIHDMDRDIIGTLQKSISTNEIPKNTIIIITADHGEEFMEHGQLMHNTMYDYNTKIPLAILIPEVKPVVIKDYVQSVDIMPTVLALIGFKDDYSSDGENLVPLLQGQTIKKRVIVTNANEKWQGNLFTIRENNWKVFAEKDSDYLVLPYEIYDTKIDPEEKNNLIAKNVNIGKRLIDMYNELNNKKAMNN